MKTEEDGGRPKTREAEGVGGGGDGREGYGIGWRGMGGVWDRREGGYDGGEMGGRGWEGGRRGAAGGRWWQGWCPNLIPSLWDDFDDIGYDLKTSTNKSRKLSISEHVV